MDTLIYKHRLLILISLAILVDFIPFLNLPFIWIETFFHEISHGLMAFLSGGSIVSITLNYNGSGLCVSQGGVQFLVSFSGYAGSALFGLLIFMLSENIIPKASKILLVVLEGVLLISLLLWAKNFSTYVILILILITFSIAYTYSTSHVLNYFLKFIGVFVVLDAIRSPLTLIDGTSRGDGATLSNLTFIPEILWVGIWVTIGLSSLYWMYQATYKRHQKLKATWA